MVVKTWCLTVSLTFWYVLIILNEVVVHMASARRRQHEDLVTALEKGKMDLADLAYKARWDWTPA